jgi:hypothetical protein
MLPQAQSAAVVYDTRVKPIVWPRRVPPGVPILKMGGGTTAPAKALRALEGALNLTYPGYARVVFMVSDGQYRPDTIEDVLKELKRLIKSRCRVVWMQCGRSRAIVLPPEVIDVDVTSEPEKIGRIVADAIIKQMKE